MGIAHRGSLTVKRYRMEQALETQTCPRVTPRLDARYSSGKRGMACKGLLRGMCCHPDIISVRIASARQ